MLHSPLKRLTRDDLKWTSDYIVNYANLYQDCKNCKFVNEELKQCVKQQLSNFVDGTYNVCELYEYGVSDDQ